MLQRDDIKKFTVIPEYMSGCEFKYLKQIEEAVWRRCLGNDLKEQMEADLVDLSGVEEFSMATEYDTGDRVKYKGTYYEAIVDNTTTSPVNILQWSLIDRFETECYNDLWCDYLGQFLSTIVLRRHMPSIETKINASGINRPEGETYDKATRLEVLNLRSFFDGIISEIYKNMSHWMKETNEDCFDDFMGINKSICHNCGCKFECECDCKKIYHQRGRIIVA